MFGSTDQQIQLLKSLDKLSDREAYEILHDWGIWGRPAQQAPTHRPWTFWLILAGRGWGKTRTGAEWVREQVKGSQFVNLIGATADDARDIMIEGEALALSTLIPTPFGWTTMGELQVGDRVFDENGEAVEIDWVSPVAEGRPCFEVTFSDDEKVIADANHKWITRDLYDRQYFRAGSVRTTAEIAVKVDAYGQKNHRIKRPGALNYSKKELPINPYVFGAWLGDGRSNGGSGYSSNDPELIEEFKKAGYKVTKNKQKLAYTICGINPALKDLNVINNKHIPRLYLEGSIDQRIALLQGLMDTDGTINDRGHCSFDNNRLDLISGIVELIRSLGMTCGSKLSKRYSKKFPNAKVMHRVQFAPSLPVFRLARKLARLKPLSAKAASISITAVTKVTSVPVKCISVKSESHLYLMGKGCTPTHNSGILAICPKDERPQYKKSERKLVWPNGATSLIFTADEPERLRGKQHGKIWADEVAAWRYPESWTQAKFGLRLGDNPQACLTTTPRPTKLVKEIAADPATVVTKGTTYDNRANLAESFFSQIIKTYEGTRLGRQELNAEILDDNPNALWKRIWIEDKRITKDKLPPLKRIVIGVDPSVTNNENSDLTGIIAAAIGEDDDGYVLADDSLKGSPDTWAKAAVTCYDVFEADKIVAEVNNGGDLVEAVLRTIDRNIPYKKVHASRGKVIRAEPIAALYEQGRIHHVGFFPELEDEMCDYDPLTSKKSPDRMDALVWAFTELALNDLAVATQNDMYGG